jgi:GDP-mannose 6-dehydrogenase
MEIFCSDTKLNISPAYLSPGFAFGGSCLPKDLRALSYAGRSRDLDLPQMGHTRIGILGFSFKAGTDDLRESPMIEIIERLAGKGYDLRIYDRNVQLAKLVGANRDFILNRIPHISKLMVDDVEAVLKHGETIVIGNKDREFKSVSECLREGQCVVDLARLSDFVKGSVSCATVGR